MSVDQPDPLVTAEATIADLQRELAAAETRAAVAEAQAAFYRAILETVNASIFALDATGRFTLSEGGTLATVGLAPGERVGQSLLELYGPQSEVAETVGRALGGEAVMMRTVRRGHTFESWLTPLRDEAGRLTGVAGVGLDITEHAHALEERERRIQEQRAAIRALSTPVLQLHERLLLLPIIGDIEAQRAEQLTVELLRAIRTARAKVVVIDITGVALLDTASARHLVQTAEACRLLGATVVVTGVSSEIARTLALLGVELDTLHMMGDLQGGIEHAERLLGHQGKRASALQE